MFYFTVSYRGSISYHENRRFLFWLVQQESHHHTAYVGGTAAAEKNYLRDLAFSPLTKELVERFELPEIQEAENAFKQALMDIADPEARNRVDMAAGKISYAFQLLGFCVGHTAKSSEAIF